MFLEREEGEERATINGVKKPNSHLAVIINENGESGVKIETAIAGGEGHQGYPFAIISVLDRHGSKPEGEQLIH